MPSAERRAILLLLGLAVGGQGVRLLLARAGEPPGQVEVFGATAGRSLAAQRDSAAAVDRPLGAGERIDVDRAPARELARLPRIGPALARTIVADREAKGPFGSIEGLDRVSGVGPGLLTRLAPNVTFSGQARGGRPAGPTGPAASAVAPDRPLNLNTATADQLDALPGIGPSRARAIVAFRDSAGPLRGLADLARLPGIGPAALKQLVARADAW